MNEKCNCAKCGHRTDKCRAVDKLIDKWRAMDRTKVLSKYRELIEHERWIFVCGHPMLKPTFNVIAQLQNRIIFTSKKESKLELMARVTQIINDELAYSERLDSIEKTKETTRTYIS